MEEGETVATLSRKELRKQKLMEYLAAKGKLKQPNPKSYLRDDFQAKNTVTSVSKMIKDKENVASTQKQKCDDTKVQTLSSKSTKQPEKREFGPTNTNVKSRFLNGSLNSCPSSSTTGPIKPKLNEKVVLSGTYRVLASKSNLNSVRHFKKSLGGTSSQLHTAAAKPNSRSSNAAFLHQVKTVSARISLGPIVKTKTGLIPVMTQTRNSQGQTLTYTPATAASNNTATSTANKMRSSGMSSASLPKSRTLPNTALNKNVNKTTSMRTSVKFQDQNRANTKPFLSKQSSFKTQPSQKSITSSEGTAFLNKPLHNHGTLQPVKLSRQHKNTTIKPRSESEVRKSGHPSKVTSSTFLSKQSSFKTQPSQKSMTSSEGTALRNNPVHNHGIPQPVKLSIQHKNTTIKPRSESEVKKSGHPSKVTSSASLGPESRYSSRPVIGVFQPAFALQDGKTKTSRQVDGKNKHSLASVPQTQVSIRRKGAPDVSQTVPQPSRTVSLTSQARDRKMTKVPARVPPQTEGRKLTAVQEERMRKLQEWREARGISYKRPPMPVKPSARRTLATLQPFWAAMSEEDEAHSLISAVDRSLADCIKLLGEGCPTDQVKEVLTRLPALSHKFAKYWICKARLMEQEGNLDVLPMFEEAVGVVLEPVDELRTVVFEILKKRDKTEASRANAKEEDQISSSESTAENVGSPMTTPKPVRAIICGERGDSFLVKYKITATPGGPQSQKKEPVRFNGQEVRFFTPVRRSVRMERASLKYPPSLKEHDLCVASYDDLISEEDKERGEDQAEGETDSFTDSTPMYVYRQNEALQDKVFVQLVYDESA